MAGRDIERLQPSLISQFARIIGGNRLSQAYIFAGQKGSGKAALATWIALRLFCTNLQNDRPCGECAECRRIESGNHPDVLTVRPDGQSIKAEAVRKLKEEMGKRSVEGHERVFIITDADRMTVSAANSLLKFFEEPLPGMIIILTTTAKNRLLPTVLSRAQIIALATPPRSQVAAQLIEQGVSPRLAPVVAGLTSNIASGAELAADEEFTVRLATTIHLVGLLASRNQMAFPYVQMELMGKQNGKDEQRQILQLLALMVAEAMQRSFGAAPTVLVNEPALTELTALGGQALANALDAVLLAQNQMASNVGFQANIEQMVLKILA